jgi:hypothetical protein
VLGGAAQIALLHQELNQSVGSAPPDSGLLDDRVQVCVATSDGGDDGEAASERLCSCRHVEIGGRPLIGSATCVKGRDVR